MAKLICIVRGGCVHGFESDEPGAFGGHEIVVRDFDNEEAGDVFDPDDTWVVHPIESAPDIG